MFGFPSSMDSAENKTFLYAAYFSRIIFPQGAYTGKICICKGGVLMDPVFPHGDVDDLIFTGVPTTPSQR